MERSEKFSELPAALAKAQAVMGMAKKNAANPHYKSKYADLADVWDTCHLPLNNNEIAVIQTPVHGDAEVGIRTMLAHSSGEWIASTVMIPVAKSDAHGIGSAMTYARRYGLSAMVGVCPEDDDGNGAALPIAKLREETLPGLRSAAMNGTQALSTAWSRLTRDQQVACKGDKDALKRAAAESDAAATGGGDAAAGS